MSVDKLSLEGLNFQATKVSIKNNILTITLNRPEKKKRIK
jgi:HSP20 family molecular chaperone IbpA